MLKNRRTISIILVVIIFAMMVFVNLIAEKLDISIDLTENEMYKISDLSRSVTADIKKDITVYCFVDDENKASFICEFTRKFCKISDRLSYKALNPAEHPEVTQKYTKNGEQITNNTIVFDNGDNYRIIPQDELFSYNYLTGQNNLLVAEEKFCTAITALNRETTAKIAFLEGHGEEYDEKLIKRVESIGTTCKSVDMRNEEISDFDILMLISPKIDFTAEEIGKLDAFLKNGGSVITAIDASIPYHESLEGFLAEWGVSVERNMVFSTDAKGIMGNNPYSVIGCLNSNPVTEGLIKNKVSPVFFASRTVRPVWEVQNGIRVTVLAESTDKASAISIDTKEEEENGAFPLLTLSQGEKGKIFTFGSNMFFNEELKNYNQDLLRNIITWSTDGELISGVSPKVVASSNIQVPKNNIVLWLLVFGIIIPLAIAAVGIIVAIRRRRM